MLRPAPQNLNGCAMEGGGVRSGLKCFREFHSRANCETRIELEVPDEKTGTSQNQTAYAPFLIAIEGPWGPSVCGMLLSLILAVIYELAGPRPNAGQSRALPRGIRSWSVLGHDYMKHVVLVFRLSSVSLEAPRFMHVTWDLAYSGSTPEKLDLADAMAEASAGKLDPTATESEKAQAQQLAELLRQ